VRPPTRLSFTLCACSSAHCSDATPLTCPLCESTAVTGLEVAHGRRFLRCDDCRLTFVHADDHLAALDELEHYRTHENDPGDPGYRRFLARLAEPLAARLPAGASGLDFGCGPGPALARMMSERGHTMAVYDPFFAPDRAVLAGRYDFVTCTEVVEHFRRPGEEFARLAGLLRPGGWLGVMTEIPVDQPPVSEWRYARDPTHVCFYRPETLGWIAGRFGWRLERPAQNVALFRAPRLRRQPEGRPALVEGAGGGQSAGEEDEFLGRES
jgi:SAM-dependent methyltransferase